MPSRFPPHLARPSNAIARRQPLARPVATASVAFTAALAAAAAHAGGKPPVGRPDQATVERGGVVTTLDSGAHSVLVNDGDPEGDRLTAVLERAPLPPAGGDGGDDGSAEDDGNGRGDDDGGDGGPGAGGGDVPDDGADRGDDDAADADDGRGDGNRGNRGRGNGRRDDDRRDRDDDRRGRDDDERGDDDGGGRGRGRGNEAITVKPRHGSLELRPDGTFVYRHDGSAGTEDGFEYFAFDGTQYSNRTRVTVRIVDADAPDEGDDAGGGPPGAGDLAVQVTVRPNPALLDAAPEWQLHVRNEGAGDAAGSRLGARWISNDGAAITLAAPPACSVGGNGTAEPSVTCMVDGLRAGASQTLVVRSEQDAPGDVAVIATLESDDSNPSNDSAAAALSVAAAFTAAPGQVLDVPGRAVAGGDVDGDDRADLVVVTRDRTLVYRSAGERLSEDGQGVGGGGSAVVLLDWNADGARDVAVAGEDGAAVHLNDGTGAFGGSLALPASGARAAAAVDLDGNGAEELALAGDGGVVAFAADGDGGVSSRSLSGTAARHVAEADLDRNGFADLIVTPAAAGSLELLLNEGVAVTASRVPAPKAAATIATDADGDGDLDLVLAVDGFDSGAPGNRILSNAGDARFVETSKLGASPAVLVLEADANGDRFSDLVAINRTGAHPLYINERNGGFHLHGEHVRAGGVTGAWLGDLTGDGAPDLALAREAAGVVEVYFGLGGGARVGGRASADVTAPQLKLIGESAVTVPVNGTWTDPGAVALDDVDGDLTTAIVVSDPVDTRVVGTYEVVYEVTDAAGNRSRLVRAVTVEPAADTGGGGGALGLFATAALGVIVLLRRTREAERSGRRLIRRARRRARGHEPRVHRPS